MKDENLAKNYARPTELESVKVLELVGALVMDSTIIGSADPNITSDSISNIRIRTNVNLLNGALRLHINYHALRGIYVLDLTFVEFAGKLEGVLANYAGSYEVDTYNITTSTKKINGAWEILIKPAVNNVNLFNITYNATSAEIRRPSDPEPNSYVLCENASSFTDGTSPGTDDWKEYNKPKSELPAGTVIAWWPGDSQLPDSVYTNPGQYIEENFPGWVLCDGKGPNGNGKYTGSLGREHDVPNFAGKFIMGFGTGNITVPGNMKSNSVTASTDEIATAYNNDPYRWTSNPATTEGVKPSSVEVNCAKIGNQGGTYLTKLLPKQQGSFAWQTTKFKNKSKGNTGDRAVNHWFWSWSRDSYQNQQNGNNGHVNVMADSNPSDMGVFGYAFLTEGAGYHENKPPYIVLAYLMKKYE